MQNKNSRPHRAPLRNALAIVAAAAIGALANTAGAQAPDACTFLSFEELSIAAGETVRDSDRVSTTEGTTCRFWASSEWITIALWPSDPQNFEDLRETLELGGETEPVAGIGDAAFIWVDRIYARQGNQGMTVYFSDGTDELAPKRREAITAIAKAGFAKL